jgi:hypothetical protein
VQVAVAFLRVLTLSRLGNAKRGASRSQPSHPAILALEFRRRSAHPVPVSKPLQSFAVVKEPLARSSALDLLAARQFGPPTGHCRGGSQPSAPVGAPRHEAGR